MVNQCVIWGTIFDATRFFAENPINFFFSSVHESRLVFRRNSIVYEISWLTQCAYAHTQQRFCLEFPETGKILLPASLACWLLWEYLIRCSRSCHSVSHVWLNTNIYISINDWVDNKTRTESNFQMWIQMISDARWRISMVYIPLNAYCDARFECKHWASNSEEKTTKINYKVMLARQLRFASSESSIFGSKCS